MQKSKLLLEPKQKKYSEEKKEKIKVTRFQKQNWKQIFCKIKRIMENIFPRSLEQKSL